MNPSDPAASPKRPRRAPLRLFTGSSGNWWLILVISGLAVAVAALFVAGTARIDAPILIDWYWLALAFFATEVFVIHIQVRQEQFTFSLSEVPLTLGLFFCG